MSIIRNAGRRGRMLAALAGAAVLALTISACSGSDNSGGEATADSKPTEMSGASVSDVVTWDPATVADAFSFSYIKNVAASLIFNNSDLSPSPYIAESWEYDDTFTELTLTLAPDQKFTDGTTLDAAAVKANLDRNIAAGASAAQSLSYVTSVEVAADDQVVIHLKQPDPGLLYSLGQQAGTIISPASFDTAKTKPVGSGAYTWDETASTASSIYVFRKNPDYNLEPKVGWDTYNIKVYPDINSIIAAATTGQLDTAPVTATAEAQLTAAGLSIAPYSSGVNALFLADRDGTICEPLGDVRVRQAINYALDRPSIINAIAPGNSVTTQMFATGTPAYDESLNKEYAYNLDEAKDLMADAGYADGFDLTIPAESGGVLSASYPVIAAALKDIGINVIYEQVPANQIATTLLSGKYAAFIPVYTPSNNWVDATKLLAPDGSFNPFHTDDPEVVDLLDRISRSTGDEQAKLFQELNAYIVDQAWFAPYLGGERYFAYDPEVVTIDLKPTDLAFTISSWQPATGN